VLAQGRMAQWRQIPKASNHSAVEERWKHSVGAQECLTFRPV